MIHTDEDDEFERIDRENAMKGQPYHYDVYVSPSQRNTVLEEVAKAFDAMKNGGDTTAGFAIYVRGMKHNAQT
jgi:hypothetical protein